MCWIRRNLHIFGIVNKSPLCNSRNSLKDHTISIYSISLVIWIMRRNWLHTKYSKLNFSIEKYPSCITNERHSIQLTGFRSSSHNLETEVGRHHYNKAERHNRLCRVCNRKIVEDEYHFLLVCPALADFRCQCLLQKQSHKFIERRSYMYRFN